MIRSHTVWKGPVDWNYWIDCYQFSDGLEYAVGHIYIGSDLVWRSEEVDIRKEGLDPDNKDDMERYFCGEFGGDLWRMLTEWKDGKLTNG